MVDYDIFGGISDDIIENTRVHISTLKPSEWYEKNMVMPLGSAFPGPFSYDLTPYWREPINCAAKDHPAREITIMKGAQLGGTVAVLNPIVGYTIAQHPGNIMFLTGHSELSKDAMLKIDHMIDNCNIRHLIRPSVQRAKKTRTGDTDERKEFRGGDLKMGSVTNHNLLRQHDVMVMIVDDFDAAAQHEKKTGSTRALVQKRTAAFAHKKKIFYVSSPQIHNASNIESVFLLGDQRYYNVPCPCCQALIVLKWNIKVNDKDTAGIYWELDNHGNVDHKSVGYVCQECAGFFKESNKYEMNANGCWVPTAVAKEMNHYSYQISSLYAPPGMDSWAFYAQEYANIHKPGQRVKEEEWQTFVNVTLGETYKQKGESPKGTELQKNVRGYEVGTVPQTLSVKDGNGRIVLLTMAMDMNGKEDDARIDYEVVGWSESGCSYSIQHGSVGTFIPRENSLKVKKDRARWTYVQGRTNSVWPEVEKILTNTWVSDDGRKMKIAFAGLDCGYLDDYAYWFVDKKSPLVIGVKGKDIDKFTKFALDLPPFRISQEKKNMYLLEVNRIKDDLARDMGLKWDRATDPTQPIGFMNFPAPTEHLYLYDNFFSHFEAEHRVIENKEGKTIAARWEKKDSVVQNHQWDCRVYNKALRDILVSLIGRELGKKDFTWAEYVKAINGVAILKT